MASPGRQLDASARSDGALAASVFGPRLELAIRYARRLATAGIERGLLGPREADRLWDRHLINCAALSELLPQDARVVDVGSGAGLPGLVLAIRRPDLSLDLVEPMARRAVFLEETVAELDLGGQVRVVRGRAEDAVVLDAVGSSEWVTARAVAPLGRLVGWCLPLLAPGGRLLALKGSSGAAELATDRGAVIRAGGVDPRVVECVAVAGAEPATVVVVTRGRTAKKGRR